ncbi:hypothetical protein F5888DRAFT_1639717 [Russula emetica]|nr:hypothetical protein F5888DRAFT_1639717 [Russula emetica]
MPEEESTAEKEVSWRIRDRWLFNADDEPSIGPDGPDEKDRVLVDESHPKYALLGSQDLSSLTALLRYLLKGMSLYQEDDHQRLTTDPTIYTPSSVGCPFGFLPYRMGIAPVFCRDAIIVGPRPHPQTPSQATAAQQHQQQLAQQQQSALGMPQTTGTPISMQQQLKKLPSALNVPQMRISSNSNLRPLATPVLTAPLASPQLSPTLTATNGCNVKKPAWLSEFHTHTTLDPPLPPQNHPLYRRTACSHKPPPTFWKFIRDRPLPIMLQFARLTYYSRDIAAHVLSTNSDSATYHRSDRSSPRPESDDGMPYNHRRTSVKADEMAPEDTQLTSRALNSDGTPRRPMNTFMIFARRRRPQVSAANQTMRTGDISKILSKEWNSMDMLQQPHYAPPPGPPPPCRRRPASTSSGAGSTAPPASSVVRVDLTSVGKTRVGIDPSYDPTGQLGQ